MHSLVTLGRSDIMISKGPRYEQYSFTVESVDKTEDYSDDETVESSKTYYKKLLNFKNKTIIKKESNNDALRMLFKGLVEHQERCQVLETSVKNIQQNEIELHESYIEELEGKVESLKKKYQNKKLDNEINNTKMDQLVKDNGTIKKQIQCVVCHTAERNVVFLPCKHFACCNLCANNLYTNKCPTCRGSIEEKQTVYLS